MVFIEFCDSCGGLLVPKKRGSSTILICRKCGRPSKGKKVAADFKLKTGNIKKAEEIVVVEKKKEFEVLPETENECPECGNKTAFWWMQQTRSIDEAPTRFYKCTKCKHTWREYE